MGKLDGSPPDRSADEQLRQNESRLRKAQAVAHVGSWELDLHGGTMWASGEAFRIYGLELTPGQLMPLDVAQGAPLEEFRPLLDAALRDLVGKSKPYDIDFRIRRASDGEIRDIHSHAEVVTDASGRPVRVDGTIQDVTERKRMETALRASEERTRMVLDQAADAILQGDTTGTMIVVNEKASELSGYAREELLGHNISMLFAPEVLGQNPLRYDLVLRGETVVRERNLTRKDGAQVPVEMHAKRLSDGTLQAILRDTTERKKAEEQAQLRMRMASIGTLAGGVAHDFNNLLAAITGYADLLANGVAKLDLEQRDCVDNILQACRRGSDLVAGLASLARTEQTEDVSFDVAKVAAEVIRVLSETTDRLIDKKLEGDGSAYFVVGSESDLYHALMNLGINAVQAIESRGARPGDRVVIAISRYAAERNDPAGLVPGAYVRIGVRDTGPGMAPEVRKHAFDPLFTTKSKGPRKGQGLGLTMVFNSVVRQHGGQIQVESTEGKGTAFHLYLKEGVPTTDAPRRQPTMTGGHGETVLVIDDEGQILDLTRKVLQRAGYQVLTAATGPEGIEVFRRKRDAVALVVLDRSLPGMTGEAVMVELKRLSPKVKIIVSSGDASLTLERFPGAERLLRKPYLPSALCEVIGDALRAKSG